VEVWQTFNLRGEIECTYTCRLTACTPGSAPGPTLGIEYGKPLPLPFNVYLPCAATPNRTEILLDCLACILNDIADLHYSYIIVGGDMNIDVAKDKMSCALFCIISVRICI